MCLFKENIFHETSMDALTHKQMEAVRIIMSKIIIV